MAAGSWIKIVRSAPRKSVTVMRRSSLTPGGSSVDTDGRSPSIAAIPSSSRLERYLPSSGGLNQRERRNVEIRLRISASEVPGRTPRTEVRHVGKGGGNTYK